MRRVGTLVAAVVGAVALAAVPAQAAPTTLNSTMTAEEEVPTPGPAGAKGTGTFQADPDAGKLCFKLTIEGVKTPTAAHIHQGAKGTPGPVKVDLMIAEKGLENCVPSDAATLKAIVADPAGFYANVHDADHPAGAVRGQLTAG